MTRIKKNDIVVIMAGKNKGKEGKVLQVFPELGRVVVEGVNVMTKHLKPGKKSEKGQKITFEAPFHISNVMLKCPQSGKPTRVRVKSLADGKRVRVSTRSGEEIT